jgi:hypothetical protein
MQSINFTDIQYLKSGTAMQQRVYEVLDKSNAMQKLAAYSPVLVGTFPLDIHTNGSDIDIICQCSNTDSFLYELQNLFGHELNFTAALINHLDKPAVVANFVIDDIPFEIFAQDVPTLQQNGYLHMPTEYHILQHFGDDFKRQVIALKASGVKTEPAFCQLLGIPGNPYVALLEYRLPTKQDS